MVIVIICKNRNEGKDFCKYLESFMEDVLIVNFSLSRKMFSSLSISISSKHSRYKAFSVLLKNMMYDNLYKNIIISDCDNDQKYKMLLKQFQCKFICIGDVNFVKQNEYDHFHISTNESMEMNDVMNVHKNLRKFVSKPIQPPLPPEILKDSFSL